METSFYYEIDAFLPQHLKKINEYLQRQEVEERDSKGKLKKQIKRIGENLWRMRLGYAARGIFTVVTIEGEEYPYFIEYLPTHKYKGSHIVKKPKALKRYLEKRFQEDPNLFKKYQEITGSSSIGFFDMKSEEPEKRLKAALKPKPRGPQIQNMYGNQFTLIDPFQRIAIDTNLPLLLSGVAGSGKSVVALKAIEKYINSKNSTRRRILYISKSQNLVDEIKAYWKALPASKNKNHTVDFISLEFLQKEFLFLNPGFSVIDVKDFDTATAKREKRATFACFCKTYFKNLNKIHHAEIELDYRKIREEFLICSGYDKETYLKLGDKQSTLNKEEQSKRNWYYAAYEAYLLYLKSNKKIDPDFFLLDLDNYDLAVIDEGQDLSPYHLDLLYSKAIRENILICMDSHQRLNSSKSVRPYLLDKMGNDPKRHHSLNCTHRCPVRVVNAANKVLAFKQYLAEGLGDKYETPNIQSVSSQKGLGSVYVCNEENLLALPWMAKKKQAYFIVITSEKNCADPDILAGLKQKFNTENVLSPEQAKGLEYDVVLAYDLYDEVIFKKLRGKAQQLTAESKPAIHQPKDTEVKGNEDGETLCNRIYTSYTRSKTALIICEKESNNHYTKVLLDRIKEDADKGLPPEDLFEKQSTKEEWEEEIIKQLQAGNEDLAYNIFCNFTAENNKEKKEELNLEELYEVFLRKLRDKDKPLVESAPAYPAKELKPANYQFFEEKKSPRLDAETTEEALAETEAEPVAITEEEVDAKSKAKSKKKKKQGDKPLVIHAPVVPAEKKNKKKQTEEKTVVIHTPKTNTEHLLVKEFEKKLFQNFNEKAFINLFKLWGSKNIKPLHTIIYKTEEGTEQNLLAYIEAHPEYQASFLRHAANNLAFLTQFNFSVPDDKTVFKKRLQQLSSIQEFFKENVSDVYSGNNPAFKLLNTYYDRCRDRDSERIHITHLKNLIDMKLDLDKIEDVDCADRNSQLHHLAAQLNDVEALHFLHFNGVNLDTPKYSDQEKARGDTLAHIAATTGRREVFEILKELGYYSLFTSVNSKGEQPVHILVSRNFIDIFKEFYDLFIKLGSDPVIYGTLNRVSHLAAKYGSLKFLEKLKEKMIRLDRPDADGYTPLVWSVIHGQNAVTAYLTKVYKFTDPSYYFTPEDYINLSNSCFVYAEQLQNQMIYLYRTQVLRPALKSLPNGARVIPINLAQLALSKGNRIIASHLKELIIQKNCSQPAEKKEVSTWTHYFSITEPADQDCRNDYLINVLRLLNPETFNEACLIAACNNQVYQPLSLNTILIPHNGEKLSVMDNILKDNELVEKLITIMVNNSYLLSEVKFAIPTNLSPDIVTKLKALEQLQDWIKLKGPFTVENLAKTESPIHLLLDQFKTIPKPEVQAFWSLFENLYQLGANLNIPNLQGLQLSHRASCIRIPEGIIGLDDEIKDGCLHMLRSLKKAGMDLLQRTFNTNETSMSLAVKNGRIDVVAYLLKEEPKSFYSKSPVSWEEIKRRSTSYTRDLLLLKEDNKEKSWTKNEEAKIYISFFELAIIYADAKHFRCYTELFETSKRELERNPLDSLSLYDDVSKIMTSAWIAAYMGDTKTLEQLYKNSVNLAAVDEEGLTIAHYAAQHNAYKVLEWIYSNKDLRSLLSQPSKFGATPASICVKKGYFDSLVCLSEKDIDMNIQDNTDLPGMKPVHIAALKGNLAILNIFGKRKLLSETLDVEGAKGVTPLMLALFSGNPETVWALYDGNESEEASFTIKGFLSLLKGHPDAYIQKIKTKLQNMKKNNSSTETDYMKFSVIELANILEKKEIIDEIKYMRSSKNSRELSPEIKQVNKPIGLKLFDSSVPIINTNPNNNSNLSNGY